MIESRLLALMPYPHPIGRCRQHIAPRIRAVFLLGLFLVLSSVSCSTVRLVSPYDEIIDHGTSDLNTKIVSFVSRMVTLSGKPEGTYDSNATFYDETKGSIATLRLRAQADEKNEITLKLLQELDENIDRLRQLHEMGKERGLSKAIADPALQAIEINCAGIIKFEIAKRRGDAATAAN